MMMTNLSRKSILQFLEKHASTVYVSTVFFFILVFIAFELYVSGTDEPDDNVTTGMTTTTNNHNNRHTSPKIVYIPKEEIRFITLYKDKPKPRVFNGIVCVFTSYVILSNSDMARKCFRMCQDMGCRICILATKELDLSQYTELRDPYFVKEEQYSVCPASTFDEISDWMATQLVGFSQKWECIRPRVIFIDQNFMNCNVVKKKEFTILKIEEGFKKEDLLTLHKIIRNLQ